VSFETLSLQLNQWVSDHKWPAAVIGFIVLYVLAAVIYSLHRRYGFYVWYFVVIVIVSLGIATPLRLYCYTFLLGMVTAFAEIISKFRDEPIKALRMPHALFYHLLNGAIAAFALKVLVVFSGAEVIANGQQQMKSVVIAGLGSMLIMRSKLFNIKVGGEDVSFGPEQIIKIYFRFMEAAIDRLRAQDRIDFVKSKLGNINPAKVFDYAVTMLLASQALEEKARKECTDGIKALNTGDFMGLPPKLKSYRLGFLLLDNMGEDFVTKVFENAPTDWLIDAPMQESYEQTFVDKVSKKLFPSGDAKDKPILYMAYGSSMSSRRFRARLGSQWQEMDETKFREITKPRKCVLAGYTFSFDGYRPATNGDATTAEQLGLANITKSSTNDVVEGVLFELVKEVVEFLDRTESGYHREKVTVTADEKTYEVEAYVSEIVREGHPPDKTYLQAVLDGAKEFSLSEEYVKTIEHAAQQAAAAGSG
jgi:hypothetical protein